MSDEPRSPRDEPASETSGLETPAPGGTRRPSALERRDIERRWQFRALVAVGAAAFALLVTTVVFATLWQQASADADRADAVQRASGDFATRFLTINTADPDAWKRRVLEQSTGAFRRTFEEGLETQLVQAFFSLERAHTDVTVHEVFVGDLDGRAAHAVVHTEVVTSLPDEQGVKRPRPPVDVYLELDLVHQDGEWLVDALHHLDFGTRGGAPRATSPAPTTTTTPGATSSTTSSTPGS